MKRNFNRIKTVICALGILMLWSSCTKYENPPAIYEDYEQEGVQQIKRKVLFISVDGAVGQEIKKIMPTNIAALLKTSKYTFDAIANDNTKDAASWMSMMSGVTYDMHQIEDDSYIPKPDENHPHENVAGYPSMLYRIGTISPTTKSYVVARDASLTNKLLVSADETYENKSDEEVKSKMIDLLEKKNPDVAIVQFKGVLEAGLTSEFSANSSAYTDAIKKVDGYIGEIVTALKARKHYKSEEWLLILTSNHGGIDQSYGGSSFQERNTFAIFQNDSFKQLELKTELMKSIRFFGFYDAGQTSYAYYGPNAFRGRNNPVLADESMYDVGKTGELTVDAKIKMNATNGVFNYALTHHF
ncbi:alkaline phosphatase family protein [Sphingobacterium sp. KU25419]|nr:alkaline phosphatase family protein [Sphingobacterium sp. KU25419]